MGPGSCHCAGDCRRSGHARAGSRLLPISRRDAHRLLRTLPICRRLCAGETRAEDAGRPDCRNSRRCRGGRAHCEARAARHSELSRARNRAIHFATRRAASRRSTGSTSALGRMPEPGRAEEVVISESFAKAHAFAPGSRFSAILNGRKRELVVVGIALSPEFIYAIGPGDIMPDDRRFGIIWMSEKALASAYDLDGAFSSVNLKLLRGASEREVIQRLDALARPLWRTRGVWAKGSDVARMARPRARHAQQHEPHPAADFSSGCGIPGQSHAQPARRTRTRADRASEGAGLPQHRRSPRTTSSSSSSSSSIGIAIGSAAGTWLGIYVTRLFGDFFHFPFLVFAKSPDLYLMAAALSLVAAIVGAVRALREVVDSAAGGCDAAARSRRVSGTCPARVVRHRQDPVATDHDDAAQYRTPSDPGGIHDAGHGARDGDPRRVAFHQRHHGAT